MLESSVPEKLATAISSGIFFPSSLNLFIAPIANVSVKAKIALKGIRRNMLVYSKRECLWCSMIVFPMDLKFRKL